MAVIFNFLSGIYSLIVFILNTTLCCIPLIGIALLKLTVPIKAWRRLCTRGLHKIAYIWTAINTNCWINIKPTKWNINGLDTIDHGKRYLVIANHQSWSDISILQKIFYNKVPLLTFFIKQELLWIPLLGIAWWALDFPFMKRYSKEKLKKKPHLKGTDLQKTKELCRKLKTSPVSVMNFPEGTRFTLEKHAQQKTPFTHLLNPKAGGIALIISSLNKQIDTVLDVTITFPYGVNNFWALMCGTIRQIDVTIKSIPIEKRLQDGDYQNDPVYKKYIQNWLNNIWKEKDRDISKHLAESNQ